MTVLSYPEHEAEGLEPHKVGEVFVAGPDEPEIFIDISDYVDKKIDALLSHKSQVHDRTPRRDERAAHADGPTLLPPARRLHSRHGGELPPHRLPPQVSGPNP